MFLQTLPLVFVLIGLVMYTTLGGADFGAAMWALTSRSDSSARGRIREHVHRSMAPVWEANHVWLIFVLTVTWTAYPALFASIFSTLSVALFIAAVGVILRGGAYALRSGGAQRRGVETVLGLSSVLTPFMLGAAAGGIASRRVPVGNAAGPQFSSWLNPTSIAVGVLAVGLSAHLAAVYLSADAARRDDLPVERLLRRYALASGVTAALLAATALVVVHDDAHRLYAGLVSGAGLALLLVAVIAAVASLVLVWSRVYNAARLASALAVAAIIAGWVLAQQPDLLPGLTLDRAAAPHDTLVAVVAAVVAGAMIVFPLLGLLLGIHVRGRFDRTQTCAAEAASPRPTLGDAAPARLGHVAGALLVAGFALLNLTDSTWTHAAGIALLAAFVVTGFVAAAPFAV